MHGLQLVFSSQFQQMYQNSANNIEILPSFYIHDLALGELHN